MIHLLVLQNIFICVELFLNMGLVQFSARAEIVHVVFKISFLVTLHFSVAAAAAVSSRVRPVLREAGGTLILSSTSNPRTKSFIREPGVFVAINFPECS